MLSAFWVFAFVGSLLSQQVMDRLSSSASTALSIDDSSYRNMRNPLVELLEHVNGIVDSYLMDLDLAETALLLSLCSRQTLLQGGSARLYMMLH